MRDTISYFLATISSQTHRQARKHTNTENEAILATTWLGMFVCVAVCDMTVDATHTSNSDWLPLANIKETIAILPTFPVVRLRTINN